MEKKTMDYIAEEIPEFALRPAQPAEPRKEIEMIGELPPTDAGGSFDETVYDKLFRELEIMKQSFEKDVAKGDAGIAAQEGGAVETTRQEPGPDTEEGVPVQEGPGFGAVLVSGPEVTEVEETATVKTVSEPLQSEIIAAIAPEAREPETGAVFAPEPQAVPVGKGKVFSAGPEEAEKAASSRKRQPEAVRLIPVGDEAEYLTRKYSGCEILPEVQTEIEEDILVPDRKPDLLEILHMESSLSAEETRFNGGESGLREVRVRGTVKLQTLYLPMSHETEPECMESVVPYRKDLAVSVPAGSTVDMEAVVESVEWQILNERKYRVKITLSFTPVKNGVCELILFQKLQGEELQVRKEPVQVCEQFFQKEDILELSDELMLPDGRKEIGDILCWKLSVSETNRQISDEKAVISGQVNCDVLYRAAAGPDQEGESCWFQGKSEFTQFIPLNTEGAADARARVQFCIHDASLTPTDDDAGTGNRFKLDLELQTVITLYRSTEEEVAADLYHYTKDLRYDCGEKEITALEGTVRAEGNIREVFRIPEGVEDAETVLFLSARSRHVSFTAERGKVIAEGSLETVLLCGRGQGKKPFVVRGQIPFRIAGDGSEVNAGAVCTGQVQVKELWCDRINGRQAEINGVLVFSAICFRKKTCPQIRNLCFVEEGESERQPSVVVCTAREGESLWGLAKKYRVSPESIREVNQMGTEDRLRAGTRIMIVR